MGNYFTKIMEEMSEKEALEKQVRRLKSQQEELKKIVLEQGKELELHKLELARQKEERQQQHQQDQQQVHTQSVPEQLSNHRRNESDVNQLRESQTQQQIIVPSNDRSNNHVAEDQWRRRAGQNKRRYRRQRSVPYRPGRTKYYYN